MSLHSGLLFKAENLSKSDSSYYSFLKNNKIEYIFELSFFSYYYFCSKSYGLDADSILQTKSTKDFWDGIITTEKQVYNFSRDDNSIAPFLQFFSFELKDEINSISVYKYSEDSILVLCNKSLTDDIIRDYPVSAAEPQKQLSDIQSHIENNSFMTLFFIDFSESVENLGEEKLKNNENLKLEYINVLLNELYTRLLFHFSEPSVITKASKSSANILFISKTEIPQDLIVSQLIKLFSKVIGASSELISFNFLGKTHSITEIKEFLKVI